MTLQYTDWFGLYSGSSWADELVPEAFAHPARFPRGVIRQVYAEMLGRGWLRPGDCVLDVFGGGGCGALDAMRSGLHWRGVELEQNFVTLGQANIAQWTARYAPHFPTWGTAELRQGDSRYLLALFSGADGLVASPPFHNSLDRGYVDPAERVRIARLNGESNAEHISPIDMERVGLRSQPDYGSAPGQLGAMPAGVVSSPPYAETRIDGNGDEGASGLRNPDGSFLRGADGWAQRKQMGARYGESAGNLANLPAGVVSSPPYADGAQHTGGETRMTSGQGGPVQFVSYGETEGQLAALPAGVVSSPPYANNTVHDGNGIDADKLTGNTSGAHSQAFAQGYGESDGQMSAAPLDTFWTAAAAIVAQTYALLKPGGVAAWMTGDYVRNKQRVPFGEQWLAICVAAGFEPLLWARVWKIEDHGEQLDIFGTTKQLRKEKTSFFRRLSNRNNPESAIYNEDVIFVGKPLEAA